MKRETCSFNECLAFLTCRITGSVGGRLDHRLVRILMWFVQQLFFWFCYDHKSLAAYAKYLPVYKFQFHMMFFL